MFNRESLELIQKERMELGEKKSHDYNSVADGIAICGVQGISVRLIDKVLRAYNLSQPNFKAQVTDEALRDTFLDIGNYADYAVSLLDGTWGKKNV